MKNKMLTSLITTSLLLGSCFAYASTTTCKLKNGSSVTVTFNNGDAYYTHYNKSGMKDMELKAVGYMFSSTANGNYSQNALRFSNGNYHYVTYSLHVEKGSSWDGLLVYQRQKMISKQKCVVPYNGNGISFTQAENLPEDQLGLELPE